MPSSIPYSGNPLDRVSHLRRDRDWLQARLSDPQSRFLPFWRQQVLVKSEPALAWARSDLCAQMDQGTGAVLLGVDAGVAHFAVDVSALEIPLETLGLAGSADFKEPHAVVSALSPGDAAIVAQGRGMLTWHARQRFCGVCGGTTSVKEAGYMRECDACDAEHFPRTDPVVIMLTHHGERCLLGRQAMFPKGMWSTLAGFVEPGESLEEAVRREVSEESGIEVGAVRYHASQPWPFPANLMIGCMAEAKTTDITVDRDELEDARWFTRGELAKAIHEPAKSPDLFVPPPMAIGHHLIQDWMEMRES